MVNQWPVPRDVAEVRSFLGFCYNYRRFVKSFAQIAFPLNHLLTKGDPFEWTKDCQLAFDTLKERLTSAPVLTFPCPGGVFILDTDASNTGLGAVLSQMQDGQERVLGYFSRSLSKTERNYCVTRRELLALVALVGTKLPLGSRKVLEYHLELLKDESPLVVKSSRKKININVLSEDISPGASTSCKRQSHFTNDHNHNNLFTLETKQENTCE